MYTSKRKILIPLPPSGTLARKKQLLLIRIAIALFVIIFIVIQLNVINYGECSSCARCRREKSFPSIIKTPLCASLIKSNTFGDLLPLDFRQPNIDSITSNNDTTQAILSAIPAVLHKYLKPKNNSQGKDVVLCNEIIIRSLIHINIRFLFAHFSQTENEVFLSFVCYENASCQCHAFD